MKSAPMRLSWTVLLAAITTAHAVNTSVYTLLEPEACRNLTTDLSGSAFVEDLCPGVGGYRLLVQEADPRQNVVVLRGRARTSLDLWAVVGSNFSSLGSRAEWRLNGGVPTALILRYNLSDAEDASKITSSLVVSKLGARPCVVSIVGPGPRQNVLARQRADVAAGQPCLETPRP